MAIDPQVAAELNQTMAVMSGGMRGVATLLGGPFAGALTQVPDLMKGAVMGIKDAFDSVASAVKPYVAAFAPSTVQSFDLALRDTTAVIGYALVPVLQTCTQIVRAFGDAILPVMRDLEPAIREVSGTLMQVLQPVITNLGGILRGLAAGALGLFDVLRPMVPAWLAWIDALHVASAIYQGVVAQTVAFWGAILKGATQLLGLSGNYQTLGDAIRRLAGNAIVAAAALAKLFGFDAALKQIKRAFGEGQEKGASTGFGAATNPQILGLPEWSKQIALAAFTAQGSGGESKEDAFSRQVLERLKALDTVDVKQEIIKKLDDVREKIVKELKDLPAAIGAQVQGQVGRSLRPPINAILERLKLPWQ